VSTWPWSDEGRKAYKLVSTGLFPKSINPANRMRECSFGTFLLVRVPNTSSFYIFILSYGMEPVG
jgi:hypothetical protein